MAQTILPRQAAVTRISGWDGAGARSRELIGHDRMTQHHVTVHSHGATVALAIRMRPTKLAGTVSPLREMAAVNLSPRTPSRSFIVNGLFDLIELRPLSEATGARIEAAVSSTGSTLNALPRRVPGFVSAPTTVMAEGWDGVKPVQSAMIGHERQTVHHFAMACDEPPTAGRVLVSGRAEGASEFTPLLEQSLPGDGCVNALFTGHFSDFRVEMIEPVSAGTRFGVRVASAGEELREPEVPGDNTGLGTTAGGQTPQRIAADETYVVGDDSQVLYAVPIELEEGAQLEVLGTLVEIVDSAGATALVSPVAPHPEVPDAVSTYVPFGAKVYDTGGFWDPGQPDRLIAPVSGYYRIGFCVGFRPVPGDPVGLRTAWVHRNGADFDGRPAMRQLATGGYDYLTGQSARVWANAGDYFQLVVSQTSGETALVDWQYTWLSIQHEE